MQREKHALGVLQRHLKSSFGACRPQLAQALQAEPSIAVVLPCNVVVRAAGEATTVVEAFDPDAVIGLAGSNRTLASVATDAKTRLNAALSSLTQEI